MLLGRAAAPPAARVGELPAELVDELVDAGRADGAGSGAGEHLPPCQLHQAAGLISTSDCELLLQVAHDVLEGQRRRDVLGERVEVAVGAPDERRVPRVGVLVHGVEARR